jgi:hypothetical protein
MIILIGSYIGWKDDLDLTDCNRRASKKKATPPSRNGFPDEFCRVFYSEMALLRGGVLLFLRTPWLLIIDFEKVV